MASTQLSKKSAAQRACLSPPLRRQPERPQPGQPAAETATPSPDPGTGCGHGSAVISRRLQGAAGCWARAPDREASLSGSGLPSHRQFRSMPSPQIGILLHQHIPGGAGPALRSGGLPCQGPRGAPGPDPGCVCPDTCGDRSGCAPSEAPGLSLRSPVFVVGRQVADRGSRRAP